MDPILIVGGGPVGLTASLLLSDLGVPNIVFERRPGTSIHPKAVGLNQRTMEIFRQLGVQDAVLEAAAPPRTVGRTGWYTSLTGPTDLHGRQIAVRDAWGGGHYAQEYAAASPSPYVMLPQIRMEPILREAASARAEATVRFSTEVVGIDQDDDSVTVTLAGGEQVRGSYLIGADGGKMVADTLGIAMSGPTNLVDMVSAHFSADLTELIPNQECLIYWFVNPDLGGSIGSGYLYHIGPWDSAGRSREWVFACGFGPDDPERFDEDGMRARILSSFGVDALELELHTVSHWYIQSVVADRYREGRCFLAGDAAHRIPPWGALGFNTGAQDVHNLAWKLATALREPELASLLDSYETERRAVGVSVAANSLHNFQSHGGVIDTAIGLGGSAEDGWNALRQLWSGSAEGAATQRRLDDAVSYMDLEFHAHGAEIGFAYVDGALAADPGAETLPEDTVVYRPTTRPGHHLPHAWVNTPGERAGDPGGDRTRSSTLDLAQGRRWALLVTPEHEQLWSAALAGCTHPLAGQIDLVRVTDDGDHGDAEGAWAALREVAADGAVLVRPDTIVAWRAMTAGGHEGDDAGDAPGTAAAAALAGGLAQVCASATATEPIVS